MAEKPQARKSSDLQTAFNIVNNYVGMTLLSFPFCSGQAGWAGSGMLLLLSAFCAYTGWLVVQAYAVLVAEGWPAPSYAQLGQRCLGPPGKWLVLFSSTLETFIAIPGMMIGIWKNAALLLHTIPQMWVIAGCIAVSLPANLLKDFTMLSSLSLFGIVSILLVAAAVAFDATSSASDPSAPPPPHEVLNVGGLPMAASITLAGLTGHVGLFPIYEEMRTPTRFRGTLYTSFGAIFAIYAFVQLGGYFAYGSETSVLVTNNIARGSRGAIGSVLVGTVLAAITFKLYCSVAGTVLVLVDIFENAYFEMRGSKFDDAAALRCRLGSWASAVAIAMLSYSSLQYVTALIGINSIIISVLLPLYFYCKLHWPTMAWSRKLWFVMLALLSALMAVVVACVDTQEFIRSLGTSG